MRRNVTTRHIATMMFRYADAICLMFDMVKMETTLDSLRRRKEATVYIYRGCGID